jgi:hypothetical protein
MASQRGRAVFSGNLFRWAGNLSGDVHFSSQDEKVVFLFWHSLDLGSEFLQLGFAISIFKRHLFIHPALKYVGPD